jgi:hypothetical protein
MKLPFYPDVPKEVVVNVGGATVITVAIVRVGGREAAADLEISDALAGGTSLSVHDRCRTQQGDEDDNPR